MKDFCEALRSGKRSAVIPEEDDYFGKLIGSWRIAYKDNATGTVRKGEWHFSRVLEGMAVQDVIVLPGFEYGTTLRIYNPDTRAWEIAYGYTGRIMHFEARKQKNRIILTNREDEHRKWVFAEIADNHFHWQDIMVKADGEWQVNYDLYAERL